MKLKLTAIIEVPDWFRLLELSRSIKDALERRVGFVVVEQIKLETVDE